MCVFPLDLQVVEEVDKVEDLEGLTRFNDASILACSTTDMMKEVCAPADDLKALPFISIFIEIKGPDKLDNALPFVSVSYIVTGKDKKNSMSKLCYKFLLQLLHGAE